jgi:hypothetical protein
MFFFSIFFSIGLSQLWVYSLEVSGLTLLFSLFFFSFYFSILNCLIIECHSFIKLAFDKVTLVSRSGRKFNMLTQMDSNWVFWPFYVVNFFFVNLFIIIVFLLFILFEVLEFINHNRVNGPFFKEHLHCFGIFFFLYWKKLSQPEVYRKPYLVRVFLGA